MGAGKWKRVQKGVIQGSLIAQTFAVVIVVVLLFLNKYLFGIFTETEALIDLAGRMMRIMAVGYIAISITQVLGGVMRGCGNTVTPMWISIISTVVLRIPVAYGIAYLTRSAELSMGDDYVEEESKFDRWLSEKLGDKAMGIVTAIGGVLALLVGKKKKER